ncbi:MAG: hypothetical protein OEY79_02800 [Anaplasmataceae bacterium]|nr:hypothetical protein [Anaplasmataceae bacterium]
MGGNNSKKDTTTEGKKETSLSKTSKSSNKSTILTESDVKKFNNKRSSKVLFPNGQKNTQQQNTGYFRSCFK